MAAIDFVAMPTDDVWIRDTGPVFVCDSSGRQAVVDFAFDGWGRKAPHSLDNAAPRGRHHGPAAVRRVGRGD